MYNCTLYNVHGVITSSLTMAHSTKKSVKNKPGRIVALKFSQSSSYMWLLDAIFSLRMSTMSNSLFKFNHNFNSDFSILLSHHCGASQIRGRLITGPTETNSHSHLWAFTVSVACWPNPRLWPVRRNWSSCRKPATGMGTACILHRCLGLNPRPSFCDTTVISTAPPCDTLLWLFMFRYTAQVVMNSAGWGQMHLQVMSFC